MAMVNLQNKDILFRMKCQALFMNPRIPASAGMTNSDTPYHPQKNYRRNLFARLIFEKANSCSLKICLSFSFLCCNIKDDVIKFTEKTPPIRLFTGYRQEKTDSADWRPANRQDYSFKKQ